MNKQPINQSQIEYGQAELRCRRLVYVKLQIDLKVSILNESFSSRLEVLFTSVETKNEDYMYVCFRRNHQEWVSNDAPKKVKYDLHF